MEKINVWIILRRHFSSLIERDDNRLPITDTFIFYLFPLLCAWITSLDVEKIDRDIYSAAISTYSIFAALLLSVQMALFSIFLRQGNSLKGKQSKEEEDRIAERRRLIRELNANVSFLILLSVIAASLSLAFMLMKFPDKIEVFVSAGLFIHFGTVVLLVIKRTYILFDREYQI